MKEAFPGKENPISPELHHRLAALINNLTRGAVVMSQEKTGDFRFVRIPLGEDVEIQIRRMERVDQEVAFIPLFASIQVIKNVREAKRGAPIEGTTYFVFRGAGETLRIKTESGIDNKLNPTFTLSGDQEGDRAQEIEGLIKLLESYHAEIPVPQPEE